MKELLGVSKKEGEKNGRGQGYELGKMIRRLLLCNFYNMHGSWQN